MTIRARIPHCAWLSGLGYFTVHDSPDQDTSLCMTPRTRVQDTSLCMTLRAMIPHSAWLPGPGYLTVHDSPDQGPGYLTVHDSPDQGPGYLTVHDSPDQGPGYLTVHDSPDQGPGYLTVHDSPGQDTSLCMTLRTRIPHCAWLPRTRGVMHREVSWPVLRPYDSAMWPPILKKNVWQSFAQYLCKERHLVVVLL